MASDVVLGIDLSLTGLGLVAVPVDWDLRWCRVQSVSLGVDLPANASTRERVMRRRNLSDDVARWASRRNVTRAWVEAYPMGAKSGLYNIHLLAELGGVIKDRLADLGLFVEPVAESSCRKLLLGKLPASGRKTVVFETLRSMGGYFADMDQSDAFAVANYGLSELGVPCVALPAPEQEPKRRKRRAA